MVVPSKPESNNGSNPNPVVRRSSSPGVLSILYSVTKKVGTVAIVYLLGYYNISVAWLIGPVILSVVRDEWKKTSDARRALAKAAAMSNEKEVIIARIDELPAWVYFPDVERAEWVNRIVRQLWPNANHYARDLLRTVIEPNIRNALAAFKLPGFKFDKMILGTIPFRVGGVKVYDHNVSRNEIIMDLDFFYAGDCDISFTLSGIPGGIKDFQLHGMLRVVMKPLIQTIPLVGGLQLFFLNNPTIDFNLVGAADVLDVPGVSDILRRIIVEQVAALMVLPNKLPITLSDVVPAHILKTPEPEGVLRVHVVEAKELMKMDIGVLGKGKSDPYAIITVGAQQFRTQIINNTVSPKWDYWCEAEVSSQKAQIITVQCWDWDPGFPGVQNDDFLGRASVEVSTVVKKGELDIWLTLEEAKHGMVHLRLSWHTLTDDLQALPLALAETQQLRVTSMSTAILMVYLDSAKNLPDARPGRRPDPIATLGVGKDTQSTHGIFRTDSPVWERGFTFLVKNPETDSFTLKVTDQKTNNDIGRLEYHLAKLLTSENLELSDQPLLLQHSGPISRVRLSLRLRILKHYDPEIDGPLLEGDDDAVDGSSISSKRESPKALSKQFSRGDSVRSVGGQSVGGQSVGGKSVGGSSVSSVQPSKDKLSTQTSVQEEAENFSEELSTPLESTNNATVLHRTPSATSSAGEAGLGRIQMTLRYAVPRQRLVVVIHKVANLPSKDPNSIPDPYVKLYLLPERSKESKRKTEVMKDNCNPTYDETFEYIISLGDINSRQLEVTVVTKKTWFQSQSPVMGQVILNLGDLDLVKGFTAWYDLMPETERDS
ncbi:extended synaptotagmin-1 isoform X1 [Frankliniella occidentalis]|uniref:Extended synaptotagmin-1 isoform X1 n=1 Tax=Frankliniella occidentalis TaxID=133901 RepID=A0A6J1TAT9_FRAOC|nr:extended synaptotagmin-1 isoform X1 [Frankliniella occidentalis]